MGSLAFNPQGNSVAIAVTVAASTAVQALPFSGQGNANNYLVSNSTSQAVFLAFGPNNAVAAVAPVAGTPANGLFLQPNSSQTFTFSPTTWFSTIAPTGTSTVYITPGDGV